MVMGKKSLGTVILVGMLVIVDTQLKVFTDVIYMTSTVSLSLSLSFAAALSLSILLRRALSLSLSVCLSD
jgi:hypothetical protein